MGGEDIPKNVLHFLDNCIDTVEQLMVLLLLYSDPKRVWTVTEITAELRSTEDSITKRLDDLYTRNVLVRKPELKNSHQFIPATTELVAVIRDLAEQNKLRPYSIIQVIYSRPSKSLKAFSDAFRFGGEKK